MGTTAPAASVELSHYGEVFARRWRLILVGLVLGILGAVALLALLPKTYTSTASVLVAPSGTTTTVTNGRTSGEVNLDTEAQIVTSTVVSARAVEILESDKSTRELAAKATVSVPPNSAVLDISFVDADPDQARQGAEAYAEAYLEHRASMDTARQRQTQTSITRLNRQVARIDRQVAASEAGSSQRATLEARRDFLTQQVGELSTRSAELAASKVNPGTVITKASRPSASSSPNRMLVLVSGLMLGLLAGTIVAFWRDRADRRVRDRRDLEQLGLTVPVPQFRVPSTGAVATPETCEADDLAMLHRLSNGVLTQLPETGGTLLVAPVSSGQVASSVGLNLAAMIARTGLTTTFASFDPQDQGDARGVVDVLRGEAQLEGVLAEVPGEPGLRTVGLGSGQALTTGLLTRREIASGLQVLQEASEVVIVVSAPTSLSAEAQTFAARCDGVLLVAEPKRSTANELADAADQLAQISARLVGAVLVTPSGGSVEKPVRPAP